MRKTESELNLFKEEDVVSETTVMIGRGKYQECVMKDGSITHKQYNPKTKVLCVAIYAKEDEESAISGLQDLCVEAWT